MKTEKVVPFSNTAYGIILKAKVSCEPFFCCAVIHVAPFVENTEAELWAIEFNSEIERFMTSVKDGGCIGYEIEILSQSIVIGSRLNNCQIDWEDAKNPAKKSVAQLVRELPFTIAENAAVGIRELYSDLL